MHHAAKTLTSMLCNYIRLLMIYLRSVLFMKQTGSVASGKKEAKKVNRAKPIFIEKVSMHDTSNRGVFNYVLLTR